MIIKTLEAGVVDLGISDHSLVCICRKISIPKEPPKIVFTRQFKNYNSHQFKEELSYYTNLDPTSNDPNVLWNEFKNNFLTIAEKHAPVRQRRVKSEHKPWLTKEIKRLMHHRDYLKRQSVRLIKIKDSLCGSASTSLSPICRHSGLSPYHYELIILPTNVRRC